MKILVSAGTKHGATAEIGTFLGEALVEEGFTVTVADPAEVRSADGFDAFVIGSAVYAGHWVAAARDLVERELATLITRPLWLFSSGPIGDPPKPDEEPVDVTDIIEATGAREHRIFPGKLDKSELGFGERAVVLAFRAPEGDFRDWDALTAWAGEIAGALREG